MKRWTLIPILYILLILSFAVSCSAQLNDADNDEVLLTIAGAQKTELTRTEFLAIRQYTYHLSRTNSKGKTTDGDYTGVKWQGLAEALGAPAEAESVTLTASDGFSQIYTMDILNAERSLFGIMKDGDPITEDPDLGQVWFCADESYTANYWTKYIIKIEIN